MTTAYATSRDGLVWTELVDVLREAGETDFEKYAVTPGGPLAPDFFL